ncbi:MAG: hypothetical protein HPY45_16595 [Anaerolineae bacterium]|nr:hypothetical protein [Anaerolineae bacterium]
MRSRIALIIISLLALMLNAPPRVQGWKYANEALTPLAGIAAVSNGMPVPPPQPCADLNTDGSVECLSLHHGQVSIQTPSAAVVWQSPPEWRVQQAGLTDLNRDGTPEAALLVWRRFSPWPIDRYLPHGGRIAGFHDQEGLSCHLILIGWNGKRYGELWAGSALARPLRAFHAADLDSDGQQELVVLEGEYKDPALLPARTLAVWEWNGFGFSLLARHAGRFHHLAILPGAAGAVILVGQALILQ